MKTLIYIFRLETPDYGPFFYAGKHEVSDEVAFTHPTRGVGRLPDDGYAGGGKHWTALVKDYGHENLSWRILCVAGDDWAKAERKAIRICRLLWGEWRGRNISEGGDGMTSADAKRRSKDPAYRAKQREISLRLLQDPAYRARPKADQQRMAQDPEWRANNKAAIQRLWQDPEFRAKNKAGAQRRSQDPAYKAKHKHERVPTMERPCLRCSRAFPSEGNWHRICTPCKKMNDHIPPEYVGYGY